MCSIRETFERYIKNTLYNTDYEYFNIDNNEVLDISELSDIQLVMLRDSIQYKCTQLCPDWTSRKELAEKLNGFKTKFITDGEVLEIGIRKC